MKHYPNRVNILGKSWGVFFIRQIPGEGPATRGITHWPDRVIYIRRRQGPRSTLETFIHEIKHAIEFETRTQMDHRTLEVQACGFAAFFAANFMLMVHLAQKTS